jgi:hypothetical protein
MDKIIGFPGLSFFTDKDCSATQYKMVSKRDTLVRIKNIYPETILKIWKS